MKKSLQSGDREPQKWRKYQLLARYGLTDEDYLRRTIHRFAWEDRAELVSAVRREFSASAAEAHDGPQLFVVKLVPRSQTMWLPNVRIERASDLDVLERTLANTPIGLYAEIWFCRTVVAAGHLSLAGRLLVDRLGGPDSQRIEQVWRCSPRLIESLHAQFPYPFLRASREGWRWPPNITEVHRPAAAPETVDDLREQFAYTLRLLDRVRDRMEAFADRLASVGLQVCSLEYKLEDNQLRIIDWDTGNDALALEHLL